MPKLANMGALLVEGQALGRVKSLCDQLQDLLLTGRPNRTASERRALWTQLQNEAAVTVNKIVVPSAKRKASKPAAQVAEVGAAVGGVQAA